MVDRVAWIVGGVAWLALAAGCLSFDEKNVCADGSICPVGTRCSDDNECIPLACGNGVIEGVEECEPENLGGRTCVDFGSRIPEGLACTAACRVELLGCAP